MADEAKKKPSDEIAELRAELEALKAAVPKPQLSWEEQQRRNREWDDEMHQMRERQASRVPSWLVRDTVGGVSDVDAQDLVHASHRPQGPSSQGAIPSSQQVTNVRAGGGTGWAREIPLGPPPGIPMVDAIMIADDVRQRAEKK
jgi:hypothetical protein